MSAESMTNLLIEFNKLSPVQQEQFLESMETLVTGAPATTKTTAPNRFYDVTSDLYYALSLVSSASVLVEHVFDASSGREEEVDRHGFVACELLTKATEVLNNVYTAII